MNSSYLGLCVVATWCVCMAACGSSAADHPDAAGVDASDGSSSLGRRLVRVLATDGQPIAGAHVTAGDATGTTNASGEISLEAVTPDTPLVVSADGFVPAVWLGVTHEQLDIVLEASTATAAAQATVGGSFDVGDLVSDLAVNHLWRAFVTHTLPPELDGVDEALLPTAGHSALCEGTSAQSVCAFELTSRAGLQRVYAVLLDVDTRGTDSEDDDEVTQIGLATSSPIDVPVDALRENVVLELLTQDALLELVFSVTDNSFDSTAAVVGVPGINPQDGSGVLLFPPGLSRALVPARQADFEQASYWLVAQSQYAEAAGDELSLQMLLRGVDLSDVALREWYAPPGGVALDGNTLRFEPAPDANVHALRLFGAGGAVSLDVLVVGEHSAVELTSGLGAAVREARVTALRADLPDSTFSLAAVRAARTAQLVRHTTL